MRGTSTIPNDPGSSSSSTASAPGNLGALGTQKVSRASVVAYTESPPGALAPLDKEKLDLLMAPYLARADGTDTRIRRTFGAAVLATSYYPGIRRTIALRAVDPVPE